MKLLFVCTGNLCRSAVAERLAASWVPSLGDEAALEVAITSAGTNARPGMAMDERSARALHELGGDPTGFRSRSLVDDGIGADLVLTMTRRHRRKVIERSPRAMRRTFTLVEAGALLTLVDSDEITSAPLSERGRLLAGQLAVARAFRRGDEEDDILDPIGCSMDIHRAVSRHIAACLRPLTDVLFAPVPARADRAPQIAH